MSAAERQRGPAPRRPGRRAGRRAGGRSPQCRRACTRGGAARASSACARRLDADQRRRELRLERGGQHQVVRRDGARAAASIRSWKRGRLRARAHERGIAIERGPGGMERRRPRSARAGRGSLGEEARERDRQVPVPGARAHREVRAAGGARRRGPPPAGRERRDAHPAAHGRVGQLEEIQRVGPASGGRSRGRRRRAGASAPRRRR